MKMSHIIKTASELRARIDLWRQDGVRAGLVPTMGALHAGHLSMIAEAAKQSERVVVSIFVNPKQFGPNEDFERYPRCLDQDCARIAAGGLVDIIFVPERSEIYPDGFATTVEVGGPALGLESDFRPHFFAGVATVVTKLLLVAQPDAAVFGEKDYQQLLVVRRLVRDFGLPIEIVGVPVVREPDGLAMSSRNAYLEAGERQIAARLNRVLIDVAHRIREGAVVRDAEHQGEDALHAAGFNSIDYVAVRDARTLKTVEHGSDDMRVLGAATVGTTRLIDNIAV